MFSENTSTKEMLELQCEFENEVEIFHRRQTGLLSGSRPPLPQAAKPLRRPVARGQRPHARQKSLFAGAFAASLGEKEPAVGAEPCCEKSGNMDTKDH